ncbi:MAG TPA: permease [Candidatus Mucispirillum faecigallinarum]|uniref:Permease n=1 Tax=Candidatus Mucispirillum faecigallinarum TaxID=2838699 RepID=A0A9D2GVH7_9BACT|nr:permease [Candidatus Mucispirillum faecigallinarum]
MKEILLFIQNQILGMKFLDSIIGNLLEKLGIDISSKFGGALHFFMYDVIKIFILLFTMIFIISYIQSYFPPERSRQVLGKYKGITSLVLAALLGTITPFCSCSSIPLFIGFVSAGLPLGVVFAFLISSPLVDLGSIVLLSSMFGFNITAIYVLLGLILAVAGGALIDKLKMENYIADFIKQNPYLDNNILSYTKKERLMFAKTQTMQIVKKVYIYIFIGVGLGAFIHNYIPENYISMVLGGDKIFAVPLAVFFGAPMYADIFGVIPIAESLYLKGAGLGTVMSFMMAVTALSLPSIIMLKQVVKGRLLFTFIAVVITGIIISGYLFNYIETIL